MAAKPAIRTPQIELTVIVAISIGLSLVSGRARMPAMVALGALGAVLLVGRMVARRESDRARRDGAERFRMLVDCVRNYAIFMVGPTGTVMSWNAGAERITGYPAADIIGQHVSRIYPPGDGPESLSREMLKQAADDGHHEAECWRVRKDGSRFWADVVVTALRDRAGALLGYAEMSRDVSERKKASDAVAQNTIALERSNDELQQFAYVVSHDLQEPLRTVAGYVQLLAARYTGRLDPAADEIIGSAVEGAKRMQRQIEGLLEYSREGSQERAFRPTSSESALESALSNLGMAIREAEAVVTHGPLPVVLGDDVQLVLLFQNLVSNALKYRGTDVPHIHIGSAKSGRKEWTFTVQDNGIGIAPDCFERIFVMFQRLHGRAEFTGTGIGLTLCKKIVERHAGRIWVESQAGAGSAFRFTLPELEAG